MAGLIGDVYKSVQYPQSEIITTPDQGHCNASINMVGRVAGGCSASRPWYQGGGTLYIDQEVWHVTSNVPGDPGYYMNFTETRFQPSAGIIYTACP